MKLETYLLLKTIVGGVGFVGAIVWIFFYVRSEVKWKEEQYKRELKRK